ncbi:tRNA adenosine deaminase-associated protein [Jatrophihabitans sp. DSM 45814]
MAQNGFVVAAYRDSGRWRCEAMPPSLLEDLGSLLSALRGQPPEGGPFVVASVDDEFFLVARSHGARIDLLLSDLTAAVEFPLAAQVLDRLGEDPPEDDELDEVWPIGELDLFNDLELPEDEMESILDDLDAYPDEMLDAVISRIGLEEQFREALAASGRVAR